LTACADAEQANVRRHSVIAIFLMIGFLYFQIKFRLTRKSHLK